MIVGTEERICRIDTLRKSLKGVKTLKFFCSLKFNALAYVYLRYFL